MNKRIVAALSATAGGLALLLNFKTPTADSTGTQSASAQSGTNDAPASSGSSRTPSTTAPPSTTVPDPPSSSSQSSSGSSRTPSTTAPPSTTTTTKPESSSGTATGDSVYTRFGYVQVEVTVKGGKITDVQALELPNSHRRSLQISNAAAPILRSEALKAQSAEIDLLSGATYTSEGYAESLQSALDELGY